MKTSRLEPGLLTIFRIFLIAQFVTMFVNLHVHGARGFVDGSHPQNIRLAYFIIVSGTLGLLTYASLPWLEKQLNRFYLPVALICSLVFSLTANYLFLTTHSGQSAEENAWQFFLFMC